MVTAPKGHVSSETGHTHGISMLMTVIGIAMFLLGVIQIFAAMIYGQINTEIDVALWMIAGGVTGVVGLLLAAVGTSIEYRRRGA